MLAGPKGARILALVEEADAKDTVSVFVPRAFEKRAVASDEEEVVQEKKESFVTVTGEREAVARVVAAIEALHAELVRPSPRVRLDADWRRRSARPRPFPSVSTSDSTDSSSVQLPTSSWPSAAAPSSSPRSTTPTTT